MINKNKRIIIINGTIITPFHLISDKDIIVEEGKIREIVNKEELNTATLTRAEVIEGKDKFIAPGYIDIHVHGGGGSDAMDGDYKAINRIAIAHSHFGTTSFFPTIMTMSKDKIIRSLRSICEAVKKGTAGAEILGIYDVLSRIIYGSRISLSVSFSATLIAAIFGILMGIWAGFLGGIYDNIIMRINDITPPFFFSYISWNNYFFNSYWF